MASKWFETARNKEPTQQGRFFVFQKEGGFERTECERRRWRMQRARRAVPQHGEMSRRQRGEIEPHVANVVGRNYDEYQTANEHIPFLGRGIAPPYRTVPKLADEIKLPHCTMTTFPHQVLWSI